MRVSFTETARPQNPPEIPQRPEPHVKSISICVGLFYFVGSERDRWKRWIIPDCDEMNCISPFNFL